MSTQGVDFENEEHPPTDEQLDPLNAGGGEGEGDGDGEETDEDGIVETVTVGQQRMVPLGELLKLRKSEKALKKELAAIKPQVATVQEQLEAVRPYVEKLRANPKLIEQLQDETAATRTTPQPKDDTEAQELAEDMGLYDTQGGLDVARARRMIDRFSERARKEAQAELAPLRRGAAETQVEALKRQALTARAKDGEPMATPEAVEAAYRIVPAELAAQPGVNQIMLLVAAGIDRYYGKSARAAAPEYDDPIYSEPPANRRGPAALSQEDRALAKRMGVSEKEYQSTLSKFGQSGRGGTALE